MKYKITQDRILLQQVETPSITQSGFKLPESLQDKVFTVVATGVGRNTEYGHIIYPPVNKGDKVMTSPNAGLPIKLDGVDYRLINPNDITVILD